MLTLSKFPVPQPVKVGGGITPQELRADIDKLAKAVDGLANTINAFFTRLNGPGALQITQAKIDECTIDASTNGITLPTSTFTPGISFGGGTTGITYTSQSGAYTEVGDRVIGNGYIVLSAKGSSTGNALITGLPFTCKNEVASYSPVGIYIENITFANIIQAYVVINATTIALTEVTEAGTVSNLTDADFANNSAIIFTFSYKKA